MTLVRRGTDSRGHKVEDDVGVARPIPVPAWTDPEAEGELATNVSQRWLRSTTSDGRDVIHATIRQPLVAGQQHAEVDIAFCPPFAGVPEVSLEVASDMDADVRATRVFSYGAHIEIKLDSPCEDDWEIVIQVFARR